MNDLSVNGDVVFDVVNGDIVFDVVNPFSSKGFPIDEWNGVTLDRVILDNNLFIYLFNFIYTRIKTSGLKVNTKII